MIITAAKDDCKGEGYSYIYKDDDMQKENNKTCTKTIYLPVSKVFISMIGCKGSRERGKRQ